MHFIRYYEKDFDKYLKKGKVAVIYGPRRVGKTTLIEKYLESYSGKYYFGTGEDSDLKQVFGSQSVNTMKNFFGGYDLVVIDEAQMIPDVGIGLKILVDQIKDIKVIASGSSSFDLSNKLGEPLTGRKITLKLYPVSALELSENIGGMAIYQRLEEMMIYGTYPEVLNAANNDEKKQLLTELRDSYLYKDIIQLENIRNSSKIMDLLVLLSFQIGKEVSLNELSNSLDLAKQTVEKYLDLLEKTFVIKKIRGFSRNLRKEVSKTARYYFLDNGVLNSIGNTYNPLNLRKDTGALWENYLFSERLKQQQYHNIYSNNYFWRTYDMQEIDFVEERDGKLFGYEFKFSPKNIKAPKAWSENYPDSEFTQINKENFMDFIM
ncbi:MAG: ATP-binding protein [Candidatus Delongbacteria bacterium]|nr:ATP-binding protein [Candidatus Delongbacteria bacterium]